MNQQSSVRHRFIGAPLLRLGVVALALLLSACGVGQAPADSAAEPVPTAAQIATAAATAHPAPAKAPTAAPARTRTPVDALAPTPLPTSTVPDAASLVVQGIAKAERKDYQGAIADFTQALALDDYGTALQIDPHNIYALSSRADLRFKLEDVDAASADIDAAIAADPNNAAPYCTRARIRMRTGELAGAIDDGTTAIRLDPNDACAYYTRGQAYDVADRQEEAIADYTSAIQFDPTMVSAYIDRGYDRKVLKDQQGALSTHESAPLYRCHRLPHIAASLRLPVRPVRSKPARQLGDERQGIEP